MPFAPRSLFTVVPAAVLLAALSVAGAPAARAQAVEPDAGPADRFSATTDVVVVEVPVQVVVDGLPVRGLQAEDFRVFDEGVPRAITSFEVIDLDLEIPPPGSGTASASAGPVPTPAAGAAIDPAGQRHLLLFFDLAFGRATDIGRGERAARALVASGLHPSDRVGVAFYTPRAGVALVQDFTTDRAPVLKVLDALRGVLDGDVARLRIDSDHGEPAAEATLRARAGAVDFVLSDLETDGEKEMSLAEQAIRNRWAGPADGLGGMLEYNKLSNMMWSAEQQIFDRRAGKIVNLVRSIDQLAKLTAGLRGSKHLLILSGGFDASLLDSYIEPGPRNGRDVGWWASGGGDWVSWEVERMIEGLRRAGWIVQAVELAGHGARASRREGLSLLARETGGALFDLRNDLSQALDEVVHATSLTYLLTFTVDARDSIGWEDGFRELRVEVEGLPRRARVSHRAGYPAAADPARRAHEARQAELHALLVAAEDRDEVGSVFRAAALPKPAGGWHVPIVVDVPGRALLSGDRPEGPGIELLGFAYTETGKVADSFVQRVDIEDGEAREALPEGGLRFLADLHLPEDGRYRLRLVARSLKSGAATVRTLSLAVGGGEVTIPEGQEILLAEAGGRWIVARER